jgi:hypothetical protein
VSTVRDLLGDLLAKSFPQPGPVDIQRHPGAVDPPAKPTIMLRLDTVAPGASRGQRAYTFALVLLSTLSDPDASDDQLDALLEATMSALDRFDPNLALTWATVTRGTYRLTVPAYEIPVTVHVAVTP